ncbi:MAG: HAD family phosphatase [Oscillospiraceae bacterium]|nr:HAD family phosphatase [Oscillospiraceae bacterium]
MRNKPAAAIFDMDGTLFDSEKQFLHNWSVTAAEFGLQDADEALYSCLGANWRQVEDIFVQKYGPDVPFAALKEQALARYTHVPAPVKPGVPELLAWLQRRGVPMAVASGSMEATIRWRLENAGIAGYFAAVVDGNRGLRSKPAPDIFLEAARQLEAEPTECWVMEDSFSGVRGARAAGMYCIMVPDMVPPDEEIRRLATVVLPSLAEAVPYLAQWYGEE